MMRMAASRNGMITARLDGGGGQCASSLASLSITGYPRRYTSADSMVYTGVRQHPAGPGGD